MVAKLKLKQVRINPARILPQQEAAKRVVSLIRMRQVRVATYLTELIRRAHPSARQGVAGGPDSPAPVEPALAEVE